MYQVICFSVHEKEVASTDYFKTREEAILFVEKDSQNVYDENIHACGVSEEGMYYTISDNGNTYVSFEDQGWIWEIIEIPDSKSHEVVNNALEKVYSRSFANATDWWKDDFETEICIETEEDFKKLSPSDLKIAKKDWVDFAIDGFFEGTLYELQSNEESLKKIYEIVKEELFNLI